MIFFFLSNHPKWLEETKAQLGSSIKMKETFGGLTIGK